MNTQHIPDFEAAQEMITHAANRVLTRYLRRSMQTTRPLPAGLAALALMAAAACGGDDPEPGLDRLEMRTSRRS